MTPTKTDSFSNTPPGPIKFGLFVESSLASSETFPFRDGDESRVGSPRQREIPNAVMDPNAQRWEWYPLLLLGMANDNTLCRVLAHPDPTCRIQNESNVDGRTRRATTAPETILP